MSNSGSLVFWEGRARTSLESFENAYDGCGGVLIAGGRPVSCGALAIVLAKARGNWSWAADAQAIASLALDGGFLVKMWARLGWRIPRSNTQNVNSSLP